MLRIISVSDTIQQETHTFSEDKFIYPPIEVKIKIVKHHNNKNCKTI